MKNTIYFFDGNDKKVILDEVRFTELSKMESLQEVGAFIMAITNYAYGTSLDFAHAMADGSAETKEAALKVCRQMWDEEKAHRKESGMAN